jgi:hypothetical protein
MNEDGLDGDDEKKKLSLFSNVRSLLNAPLVYMEAFNICMILFFFLVYIANRNVWSVGLYMIFF